MTSHSQPVGAPERIYLHLDEHDEEPWSEFSDASWSGNKIDDMDVEYVRVYPMPQGIAEARKLPKDCPDSAMWGIHGITGKNFFGRGCGLHEHFENCDAPEDYPEDGPNCFEVEINPVGTRAALESTTQRLALMESQVPQWQAIETAPKDGTMISVIDITRKLPTQFTAYWSEWENETGWLEPRSDIIFNATHWMPLMPIPVPPIEGQVR